jgi:hypothetical protein
MLMAETAHGQQMPITGLRHLLSLGGGEKSSLLSREHLLCKSRFCKGKDGTSGSQPKLKRAGLSPKLTPISFNV